MIKKPSMKSKLGTEGLPPMPEAPMPEVSGKTSLIKKKGLGGKNKRPPTSKNKPIKPKKEKITKQSGGTSGILSRLFKKNGANLNEEYQQVMKHSPKMVIPNLDNLEPYVEETKSLQGSPLKPFSKKSGAKKQKGLSFKGNNPSKQPKKAKQKGDIMGGLLKKSSRKDNRSVGLFKIGKDYVVEPEYILDDAIVAGMNYFDSLHGVATPDEIVIDDTPMEDTVVFIEEGITEPIDLIEFPTDIEDEPIIEVLEENSDIIVMEEVASSEEVKSITISEQELVPEDNNDEEVDFNEFLKSDVLASKIYNINEIED